MPDPVPVRPVQLGLALAYAGLATLAVIRLGNVIIIGVAGALALIGFVSSHGLPDIFVPREKLWRLIGIGGVIVVIGAVADAFGSSDSLGWAATVLAYCAGNRFRASRPD
ncbi:MAG TPA: hypothetical protein VH331_06545 [Allosphingosinicella sp.]|jgi:hypothetical protein|nr:hypothetical protein [Allosphingosinicella sp.]